MGVGDRASHRVGAHKGSPSQLVEIDAHSSRVSQAGVVIDTPTLRKSREAKELAQGPTSWEGGEGPKSIPLSPAQLHIRLEEQGRGSRPSLLGDWT